MVTEWIMLGMLAFIGVMGLLCLLVQLLLLQSHRSYTIAVNTMTSFCLAGMGFGILMFLTQKQEFFHALQQSRTAMMFLCFDGCQAQKQAFLFASIAAFIIVLSLCATSMFGLVRSVSAHSSEEKTEKVLLAAATGGQQVYGDALVHDEGKLHPGDV
jgi:hypothetical protein